MPYIKPEQRELLDPVIDAVAEEIIAIDRSSAESQWTGMMNYAVSRLAVKLLPARNYNSMSRMHGVLADVPMEWYRRMMAPYEDEKIAQNGDVYE